LLSQAEGDPNSVNAKKKAAKKAAKKAQKTAFKQGDDSPEGQEPASKPAAAVRPSLSAANIPAYNQTSSVIPPALSSVINLEPLQVAINPNAPLIERPVVAMSVAVLTDTAIDLEIISDHKCRHTAMGLPEASAGVVTGDFAMARYLARRSGKMQLAAELEAAVDTWVDYAQSLVRLESQVRVSAVSLTLEHALLHNTYLVGQNMTLADLCVFCAIGFPTQTADRNKVMSDMHIGAVHARRWVRMMASHPALQEATQLCVGIVSNAEAVFDDDNMLEPLVSGMNTLEGAVAGRVVTRFPPEPSGYLHIGHAKAVLLNDYYARRYKGRLIVRFDDTNPSKEKEEYQESIVADLAKLGVQPDLVTFTSDYFDVIAGYAMTLIQKGLAYMDDTPQEQMKIERGERLNSKHRDQTLDESLKYFKLMCSGSQEGSTWCLRAKINMQSDNGTMRDPVLFRQNLEPHHRCGTKFKAYPTYDMACPIVDCTYLFGDSCCVSF
jgi:hypothetical protein